MTMLSPAATYHAELRQQLESVGRALSVQRGLLWLARGLVVGTVVVLGLVVWAWTRDGVGKLALPLLVAAPVAAAFVTALGSLFIRHNSARLQERSTTALELGGRGEEFPLAIAQMRDAVEHLKRVDLLEAFPLRLPRNELMASFFVVLIAAIVGISPNPWLLRARASNPAITIAREQAQRVQRLADSIQPNNSAEIDALRQLISRGAKTIDARSNEPDAALNALQDLEQQVQQMSAGDDQLAAATSQMSSQDKTRVAQVLRDAAGRAGRVSQSVANNLSNAADGMQAAAAASAANAAAGGDPSQSGQAAGQADPNATQSATDALNQLSDSTAAADARQRAASQLESSRNALERALGRTQSRSGSTSGGSTRPPSSSQGANGGQNGSQGQQGSGQGQLGDQQGSGADSGGGPQSGDPGNGGDSGEGGGYSTGGQGQGNNSGSSTGLDVITSPQQVPSNGGVAPNESSINPYTSDAGSGNAQTAPESVQPNYSSKPTQGNDSGTIPIGLRDLVKDYFSSLDQK